MGTHSYDAECPRCGKDMNCCSDTRSGHVSGECLECGYSYYTKEENMTLEEVNERRIDWELKPLKELRKQN